MGLKSSPESLKEYMSAGGFPEFLKTGECDFVAVKNGKTEELVQVCYELTPDNIQRETTGLLQAMHFFNKRKGTIVTFSGSDLIKKDSCEIKVIPAHKYLVS